MRIAVDIDSTFHHYWVDLPAAVEAGIAVATILHPQNREVCETEDVICARDGPELGRRLAPLLEGART